MSHNDDDHDTVAPEPEAILDHLFPAEPEMTPEQAEENLRRVAEAMETIQQEEAKCNRNRGKEA